MGANGGSRSRASLIVGLSNASIVSFGSHDSNLENTPCRALTENVGKASRSHFRAETRPEGRSGSTTPSFECCSTQTMQLRFCVVTEPI